MRMKTASGHFKEWAHCRVLQQQLLLQIQARQRLRTQQKTLSAAASGAAVAALLLRLLRCRLLQPLVGCQCLLHVGVQGMQLWMMV
jgi:hypothetical protein